MRSMGQPTDRLHRDGPIEGKANQSEQVFRDGRAGNHPRRGTDYRQRGEDGQEPKIPKRHGSGLPLQTFDDFRPLGNDGHGPRENHDPKIMTDAGEFILRRQPFAGIGAPDKELGLTVRSFDNAVYLQHVGTDRNLEMRCNIFGGAKDAKSFRGALEGVTMSQSQLDDVWNVTTIRSQTREAFESQNDLFNTTGAAIVIELNARQPQHARVWRTSPDAKDVAPLPL
jgi:hypothetical protein